MSFANHEPTTRTRPDTEYVGWDDPSVQMEETSVIGVFTLTTRRNPDALILKRYQGPTPDSPAQWEWMNPYGEWIPLDQEDKVATFFTPERLEAMFQHQIEDDPALKAD